MPADIIRAEILMKNPVSRQTAWEILSDFKSFPEKIDSVTSVRLLERNVDAGKSEWDISVDGAPLNWIEKEKFNSEDMQIRFEALSGDFDSLKGIWDLKETDKGILLGLTLEYRLEVPVIEAALGEVFSNKLRDFAAGAVEALANDIQSRGYQIREDSEEYELSRKKTQKVSIYEVVSKRDVRSSAA